MNYSGEPVVVESTPYATQENAGSSSAYRSPLRFLRPRSLLVLVLSGFLLVATPLIFVVLFGAYSVDRLASKNEAVVYQAVKITQGSRMLIEQLVDMERSARQYQVLDDAEIFSVFTQIHSKFTETIQELLALPRDAVVKDKLQQLVAGELALYDSLNQQKKLSKKGQDLGRNFSHLNELATALWEESISVVGREVDNLDKAAHSAKRMMLRQTVLLIPIALVLVIIFTYLIARPIRQLDDAIHRLGDGNFENPIKVSGPLDLEDLGKRLDWLRKRLVQLENEKQRFLRNVSHEFKTPLATIREGADLLADEIVGELNTEQREVAGLINSGSIQLQRLIENLLDYQLIDSQSALLNCKIFDLYKTILSVLADQKILIMSKNIVIDTRLQQVSIRADEEKVKSVICNLLSNAIKYSPNGGTIMLSLRQREATVRFEVHDEGPGIAPAEREQIFDMFYQGKKSQTWNMRGTGLGLAIVREFVLAHNGSVEFIESEQDSSGAAFRVDLPLNIQQEDV